MNHFSSSLRSFILLFIFFTISNYSLQAQTWTQVDQISSPVRQANAHFGGPITISGDYAVVSATAEDNLLENQGAAYILHNINGSWTIVKKLTAPVPTKSGFFGRTVSIDGKRVVIGCADQSVYIYELTSDLPEDWVLVQQISQYKPGGINFGSSVSLNGDYLMVGASFDDTDVNELNPIVGAGSALLYKKNTYNSEWNLIKKITASVRGRGDSFGVSVSLSGEYAIVGANFESEDSYEVHSLSNSGSAYVFKKDKGGSDNWGQVKKVTCNSRRDNAYFGFSVGISGEYAIVGAYLDAGGRAYIFKKDQDGIDNWGQIKQITPTSESSSFFGASVAINGEYAMVGSHIDSKDRAESANTLGAGSASIYKKDIEGIDNWGLFKKISAAKPNVNDNFGYNVALTKDYAFVASINEDALGFDKLEDTGSLYIFRQVPCNNIADMEIPTVPGIYQSVNTIKEGNLMHFCDCANNLLLMTIDQSRGFTSIPDDGIKIKVENTAGFYTSGTSFINFSPGLAISGRKWSVNTLVQPATNLRVRVYYTTEDYNRLNITLLANNTSAMTNENQMLFYNRTENRLNEFPEIADIPKNKVTTVIYSGAVLRGWLSGAVADKKYGEFNVYYLSDGGFGSNPIPTALPVSLISFTTKKVENKCVLEWTTSSEVNAAYFEIQKSDDAKTWKILSTITASNITQKNTSYTFSDENPFGGENFYRLKMVDQDGTYSYSSIKSIKFENMDAILVYPNPVSSRVYFTSGTNMKKIEFVKILNLNGELLNKFSHVTADGIPIDNLVSGLYVLEIKNENTTQFQKLVIVR